MFQPQGERIAHAHMQAKNNMKVTTEVHTGTYGIYNVIISMSIVPVLDNVTRIFSSYIMLCVNIVIVVTATKYFKRTMRGFLHSI